MRFLKLLFLCALSVSFFAFACADDLPDYGGSLPDYASDSQDYGSDSLDVVQENISPVRISKSVVFLELNGELVVPTRDREVNLKTFAPQQELPRQKVTYVDFPENAEIITDSDCEPKEGSCDPFLLFRWSDVEGKVPFGFKARIVVDSTADIFTDPEFPLEDTRYNEFTLPSTYIESDDPHLKFKAQSIVEGAGTELEAVRRLVEWVHNYVEYDLTNDERIFSAKEVFESKRGVCDEYGHLFAALARGVGIPARVVAGYSFTGKIWGYHLWVEVYVPGHGWMSVDPTYNEVGSIDASHIKIATALDNKGIGEKIFSEKGEVSIVKESVLKFESMELSKDSVEISLDFKDSVKKSEIVEITAHLKNKTNSHVFVPVALAVNKDMQLIGSGQKEQLALLKPFGEAVVSWKVMMPDSMEGGFEYLYAVKVVSSQGPVSKNLVLKNEDSLDNGEVALGETSFSFDREGFLNAVVEVRNDSNIDVLVSVEMQSNKENSGKESVFLVSGSKKTVSLSVLRAAGKGLQLVSIVLSTDQGSATKTFNVNFDENESGTGLETALNPPDGNGIGSDLFYGSTSVMVLGVIFLVVAAIGLLVFRK